jgi:hypothetical protein
MPIFVNDLSAMSWPDAMKRNPDLHELSAPRTRARLPPQGVLAGRSGAQRPRRTSNAGSPPAGAVPAAPDQVLEQARASEARWLRGAPLGLIDGVPVTIKDNIATRAIRRRWARRPPRPRAARADAPPAARVKNRRRGARRQDHHARLRHAVLRPLQLPQAGAQPLGPQQARRAAPAPAPARPRPRAMARCTSAPTSAARCACRPAGAASSRSSPAWAASRSIRPTWAARRPDDAHRGRRRADDAVLARPDDRDSMSLPPQDIAWSPSTPASKSCAACASACCWKPAAACRGTRGARRGRSAPRSCSSAPAPCRAAAALHDAGHARWHGPLLAHALAHRHARLPPSARRGAALHPAVGRQRGRHERARRCSARTTSSTLTRAGHGQRLPALRLRDLAGVAGARAARSTPRPPTTRCGRWSTSASPCPSTCRSSRPRRSTAATRSRAAHRPADRRQALRRPRRAAGGARLRADPRAAAALARTSVIRLPRGDKK